MGSLINSIALDVAGLGLLGAGAYSLVSGKGGTAAATSLMTLGGTYLGYKATTMTASSVTPTPTPAPAKPASTLPATQ
jgi:hypothetical protein